MFPVIPFLIGLGAALIHNGFANQPKAPEAKPKPKRGPGRPPKKAAPKAARKAAPKRTPKPAPKLSPKLAPKPKPKEVPEATTEVPPAEVQEDQEVPQEWLPKDEKPVDEAVATGDNED